MVFDLKITSKGAKSPAKYVHSPPPKSGRGKAGACRGTKSTRFFLGGAMCLFVHGAGGVFVSVLTDDFGAVFATENYASKPSSAMHK